jgi:hypothetical protein
MPVGSGLVWGQVGLCLSAQCPVQCHMLTVTSHILVEWRPRESRDLGPHCRGRLGCWEEGAGPTPTLAAFPAWLQPPPPLPAAPTPGFHHLTPGLLWQSQTGPSWLQAVHTVGTPCTLQCFHSLAPDVEWPRV